MTVLSPDLGVNLNTNHTNRSDSSADLGTVFSV